MYTSLIGISLNVLPNAVYRSLEELSAAGLIKRVPGYPASYQAVPLAKAVDMYSAIIRRNFHDMFGQQSGLGYINEPQLSFVRNRMEVFRQVDKDAGQAVQSMDLIVSGLEAPAQTIFAYKRAIDRGVKIRIIAQQLNSVTEPTFHNWQKIGVEVRHHTDMEARVFIIDHRIVYFASYDKNKISDAIGMRFEYYPYAAIMAEFFEQRWKKAKII